MRELHSLGTCSKKAFKVFTDPDSVKNPHWTWWNRHGWIELRFLEKYLSTDKFDLEIIKGSGFTGSSQASGERDYCIEFKAYKK